MYVLSRKVTRILYSIQAASPWAQEDLNRMPDRLESESEQKFKKGSSRGETSRERSQEPGQTYDNGRVGSRDESRERSQIIHQSLHAVCPRPPARVRLGRTGPEEASVRLSAIIHGGDRAESGTTDAIPAEDRPTALLACHPKPLGI